MAPRSADSTRTESSTVAAAPAVKKMQTMRLAFKVRTAGIAKNAEFYGSPAS
jgi:hypothetical protein